MVFGVCYNGNKLKTTAQSCDKCTIKTQKELIALQIVFLVLNNIRIMRYSKSNVNIRSITSLYICIPRITEQ